MASADKGVDNPMGPPPTYSRSMPAAENADSYGSTVGAPPPAYEGGSGYPDTPPTYDSLFGRVQQAKSESSGLVDFLKKFVLIVLGTIGCTIFVGLVLAIPITSIILGSMYLTNCPIERYIPIYLIVAGVFGVIKGLSDLGQRLRQKFREQDGEEDNVPSKNPFDGIIGCFLFAWFIAGNVWIYRVRNEVQFDTPGNDNYCHGTLYLFAFWSTTAVYILAAFCCCCLCCAGIIGAKSSNSDSNA